MRNGKLTAVLLLTAALLLSGCAQTTVSVEPVKAAAPAATATPGTDVLSVLGDVLATELFTDEPATEVRLEEYQDQGVLTITAPGNYVLTGSLKGEIIVDTTDDSKVRLILNGAEITSENEPCIYVKNADKVIVSSNKASVSTLTSEGAFSKSDENGADAVVFSQDDLTVTGDGTIQIRSEQGHGIVSKNDLKIKGGTTYISAGKKGLSGKDSVGVEDGTVAVAAGTHAVESEGDITIEGGTLNLTSSAKDGVHAEGNVSVSGGTVNVCQSKEGMEGATVTISGGVVRIVSTDDGINSSTSQQGQNHWEIGGNPFLADDGADITISGGEIFINAGGDGIDSNGTLNVTGGEVWISGPVSEGDSALDYGSEALISGGTIVAAGPAAMAESFGSNSTQASILFNSSTAYEALSEVKLLTADGKELLTYAPEKSFSSLVLSCPGLSVGETYTLVIGGDSTEITLQSICTAIGNTGPGMHGNGQGGPGGGQTPGGQGGSGGMQPPDGQGGPGGMQPPDGQGGPGGKRPPDGNGGAVSEGGQNGL